MADEDVTVRLMRLYGLLRTAGDEHSRGAVRGEIERLLAQLQNAARAIEPLPRAADPDGPRLDA